MLNSIKELEYFKGRKPKRELSEVVKTFRENKGNIENLDESYIEDFMLHLEEDDFEEKWGETIVGIMMESESGKEITDSIINVFTEFVRLRDEEGVDIVELCEEMLND